MDCETSEVSLLPEQPSADVVDLASRALQRRSLHEHVVEILRELILEGQLKPGERVLEPELCRKLNVSRTPMREALKVLAVERLVELQPSRGAVVTSIRIEDVVEHFEMLEILDAAIGELATTRVTDAELREIEALHRKIVEHHNAGRRGNYFDANQAIHAKLAAATHNASLIATHLRFSRKITRVRYAANFSQTRWDELLAEHEEIMTALRRRDGTTLSGLMRKHVRATGRSVIAVLEQETERQEA